MINVHCPRCNSTRIIKNGRVCGKQKYKCKNCDRYFQESTLSNNKTPQNGNSSFPKRAIILLTSHRSGSTWLSDLIRCHPNIEYYPTAILYQELGLSGRRYPGDLSNQLDCSYEIEVQLGKLDKIPNFDVTQDLTLSQKKIKFEPCAIEKCHPSFFDFSPELFLAKINHLENLGIETYLIYLVREPKSLMTSFMNYQQRNSAWYPDIKEEKLIEFVTQTYQCIQQVSQQRSGLILDQKDIRKNTAAILLKIYKKLWSQINKYQESYLTDTSKLAVKYTNRETRLSLTHSTFLGKQEGEISGGNKIYQDFFNKHQELIQNCYSHYFQILNSKSLF